MSSPAEGGNEPESDVENIAHLALLAIDAKDMKNKEETQSNQDALVAKLNGFENEQRAKRTEIENEEWKLKSGDRMKQQAFEVSRNKIKDVLRMAAHQRTANEALFTLKKTEIVIPGLNTPDDLIEAEPAILIAFHEAATKHSKADLNTGLEVLSGLPDDRIVRKTVQGQDFILCLVDGFTENDQIWISSLTAVLLESRRVTWSRSIYYIQDVPGERIGLGYRRRIKLSDGEYYEHADSGPFKDQGAYTRKELHKDSWYFVYVAKEVPDSRERKSRATTIDEAAADGELHRSEDELESQPSDAPTINASAFTSATDTAKGPAKNRTSADTTRVAVVNFATNGSLLRQEDRAVLQPPVTAPVASPVAAAESSKQSTAHTNRITGLSSDQARGFNAGSSGEGCSSAMASINAANLADESNAVEKNSAETELPKKPTRRAKSRPVAQRGGLRSQDPPPAMTNNLSVGTGVKRSAGDADEHVPKAKKMKKAADEKDTPKLDETGKFLRWNGKIFEKCVVRHKFHVFRVAEESERLWPSIQLDEKNDVRAFGTQTCIRPIRQLEEDEDRKVASVTFSGEIYKHRLHEVPAVTPYGYCWTHIQDIGDGYCLEKVLQKLPLGS